MYVAWTTLATRREAERMAAGSVRLGLAACAQVEGPIESHYRWKGRIERAREFRICFKLLPSRLKKLEAFVRRAHPNDVPEWIVVRADRVGAKYRAWAKI